MIYAIAFLAGFFGHKLLKYLYKPRRHIQGWEPCPIPKLPDNANPQLYEPNGDHCGSLYRQSDEYVEWFLSNITDAQRSTAPHFVTRLYCIDGSYIQL